MNSLEVLGVAAIWCACVTVSVVVGLTLLEIAAGLIVRIRLTQMVWRFRKYGFVTEEALDHEIEYHADKWWRGVKNQNCWSRENDFKAGAKSAAKLLLREHTRLVRMKKPRSITSKGEKKP